MSSLYIHRLDSSLPVAATFSYRTKNVSIKSIEQLGSDRRVKSWNIHQACMHALIIYADWKGCIMTLMSMVGWCWLLSLAWSHALALGSRRCRDQTLVGGSTKRLKKEEEKYLSVLCRFSVRWSPARPIKFELAYSIRDSDGATTPTAIVFLTEHQPVYIDGKRSGDGLW